MQQQEQEQEEEEGTPGLPPGYRWGTCKDKNGKEQSFILTPPDPERSNRQLKIFKGSTYRLKFLHKQQRCLDLKVEHLGGKQLLNIRVSAKKLSPAP